MQLRRKRRQLLIPRVHRLKCRGNLPNVSGSSCHCPQSLHAWGPAWLSAEALSTFAAKPAGIPQTPRTPQMVYSRPTSNSWAADKQRSIGDGELGKVAHHVWQANGCFQELECEAHSASFPVDRMPDQIGKTPHSAVTLSGGTPKALWAASPLFKRAVTQSASSS